MVAGTRSGASGGAPGRFCRRTRGASGALAGCSCLGVGAGASVLVVAAGVAVGSVFDAASVVDVARCAPGSVAGFAAWPGLPLALRLAALVESKPLVPAPTAGR